MMRGVGFAVIGLAAIVLAGCNHTTGPGQGLGTVGGAVAGGVVGGAVSGGKPLAIVGGAAVGGVIGNLVGRELDQSAQKAAAEAEYKALEFGRAGVPVAWRQGSARGEVTPGPLYQVNAYNCRDYTHAVTIGSEPPQSGRGTACRQPNGAWQEVT
jgi:surface antigen